MTGVIQVEGLRELLRDLRQLPKELQGPTARRALFSGSKITKNAARALVPVDSGFLREQIITFAVKRGEHQYDEQVRVGIRKRARKTKKPSKASRRAREQRGILTAFYWRFLEFGTSRMAARPFLRPAFERTKAEAAARIKQAMRENIDKAARKLAGT